MVSADPGQGDLVPMSVCEHRRLLELPFFVERRGAATKRYAGSCLPTSPNSVVRTH